ncbi:MAG: LysR family transcriptional regulator [Methylobacteriaceae bacterium]|nr:LysR family transcriptional regulator [Methylobacteriaceae bacterium]
MRPDSRHAASCLVLAEELHFGRAAARLNMTQPGLSRMIGELEERVGVELFRRTTRTVEITEAGKAFLSECRVAIGHLDRAVTIAQRTAEGLTGTLRVAYMDFAINGRLPELVRAFRQFRPDIRVSLSHFPTQSQQDALLADKIDIGFSLRASEGPRFDSYRFDTDTFVALLPTTHRLSSVKSLTLGALADEPFVLGSGESWGAYRESLFKICLRNGFQPKIAQDASSSDGIFGLVAAGIGVTCYASCVRNLQRRGIVVRSLDDVPDPIPISAIWMKPVHSPVLAVFIEFLKTIWGSKS